ncbi:MAG: sugar ABC transporter permease [Bacilli bacterium]|jgi:ABC-type sugar transport system permease subunit
MNNILNIEVYGEFVEHRVIERPSSEIDGRKKTRRLTKKASERIFIIAMLFFPILQFVVFWVVPNFDSIIMGFQNASGGFTLNNFKRFFEYLGQGKDFLGQYNEIVYAIKNSLIYFAVNIFISTPIVIFFSYVLFKRVPMAGLFKVLFYLPSIIGATVTTTLFRMLLLEGAPVYNILKDLGFITEQMELLGLFSSESTAFTMVIAYSIWTCVGINMIMFYGAMRRIPNEIFESAEIDGVGFFQQFVRIVVPLIWPTITTLIIFSLSGMFISYGAVMILTPDVKTASMVGWYIIKWTTATDSQASLTYPAAVGLIFTVVGLPFVLLIRWLLNKVSANVEY